MDKPTLSYEFFPPRNEAQSRRFWRTLGCLETLNPSFVSVTFGALGSASQASVDTVEQIRKDGKLPVAAHLTCSGQTRVALMKQLDEFKAMGVDRIVALRGDKPAETTNDKFYHLRYATELIELIQEVGGFDISVAAYPEVPPEASSPEDDMEVLKLKMELGGARALTQFFFEPETFLRWRDDAVSFGIDKPLIPGILPVHDIKKVIDFSSRCGATVPASLVERFANEASASGKHQLAIEHCVDLCTTLQREGVDDFHMYTLNQSNLAYEVSQALLGEAKEIAAA